MNSENNFYSDTKYIRNEKVDYEIIYGNEKIVFIKAGANGSARGYADKYIRMAKRIHKNIGATVICASNPDAPHENLDEEEIRRVIDEKGLHNIEISFVGVSDGAYHNISLAKRFPETEKMIGINTSYVNISDLKEKLNELPNVNKILIFGTEDDDFNNVVPDLSKIKCENFEINLIEGADHRFTGMVEEFIVLADYLN